MSCRPRPRALSAALLVVLAACASLLGLGATASLASSARSTVAGSHGHPAAAPASARPGTLREVRDAARRLHRERTAAATAEIRAAESSLVRSAGPPGVAAVLTAALLAGLLGRVVTRTRPVTAPVRRTAGSHRGRAPPAPLCV